MDKTDPYEITRAIADLKMWEQAARHNWALVPQTSDLPYIATAMAEKPASPVEGRLMLFPGLNVFRDYVLSRQISDFGVYMSPLDFPHFEAVGLRNGNVELFNYRSGFVPQPPTSEQRAFFAPILYECYGFLLRLSEKPDLPLTYLEKKAMFARKEVLPDNWIDGPLMLPKEEVVQMQERISLQKDDCAKAKELPVFPKEVWEVDYVLVPAYHTPPPDSRFLYLFVAVNQATGERMVWQRLSVDGKENGLLRLWEGHAQRLLTAILGVGRVPGEIHVRSRRMTRFLRPLGMQLPFKIVQHAKLPLLESVLTTAIQERKV